MICFLLMCEMTQIINGKLTYRQWRVSYTVVVIIVFYRLMLSPQENSADYKCAN